MQMFSIKYMQINDACTDIRIPFHNSMMVEFLTFAVEYKWWGFLFRSVQNRIRRIYADESFTV